MYSCNLFSNYWEIDLNWQHDCMNMLFGKFMTRKNRLLVEHLYWVWNTLKIKKYKAPLATMWICRQKAHSNRTRCWCRRAVSSTTSTIRAVAGSSRGGTPQLGAPALSEGCDWGPSQCCCLAASACSLASSLFAAQSILKVRLASHFTSSTTNERFCS